MPYNVLIRKNSTGEIRDYVHDGDWEDGDDMLWSERGYYGCDCARSVAFSRAADEPDNWEDRTCGLTEFTVLAITLSNSLVVYRDD